MKKILCPYCEHEWNENVKEIYEAGKTPLVKGGGKPALGSPDNTQYVDLVCPRCKREFEYPLEP